MQIAPRATLILMHAVEVPFEGKLRQAEANDEASDNMTLLAALTINMAEIDRVAIDRHRARHEFAVEFSDADARLMIAAGPWRTRLPWRAAGRSFDGPLRLQAVPVVG